MPVALRRHALACFRRGFVLLGVAAIVAGFLGMHVMAGMHGSLALEPGVAGHHSAPNASTGHVELPSSQAAACGCGAGCADHVSMHPVCTPSSAAASLAAPAPGMASLGTRSPGSADGGAVPVYSYAPGSPSPGDLSISRT